MPEAAETVPGRQGPAGCVVAGSADGDLDLAEAWGLGMATTGRLVARTGDQMKTGAGVVAGTGNGDEAVA